MHHLNSTATDLCFVQRPVERSLPRFMTINSDDDREPFQVRHL
jgi:hypothetical protein